MWTTRLKQFLYPLYIYPKIFWISKNKLNRLYNYYHTKAIAGEALPYDSTGIKVFSNMEEDGITLWLIASLNIKQGFFIDIGSNDCINSNCANLVFNFNWQGIFIDGDKRLLRIGKRMYDLFGKTRKLKLQFLQAFVTTNNINDVILNNKISNEIDFMSIDIDGNDYAIWNALTCIQPKIIVIENKIEYGCYDVVIPSGTAFQPNEWGASPLSITKLAREKGYTLVAANRKGFNTFYLRNDLVDHIFPELAIEVLLSKPDVKKDFYTAAAMDKLIQKMNTKN